MLVSVCVASIRGNTIASMIKAIQEQDYPEWELIIGIQGNDPKLLQITEQLAKSDKRIRILRLNTFGEISGHECNDPGRTREHNRDD